MKSTIDRSVQNPVQSFPFFATMKRETEKFTILVIRPGAGAKMGTAFWEGVVVHTEGPWHFGYHSDQWCCDAFEIEKPGTKIIITA